MGRRMYHKHFAASILVLLAGCGDRSFPDLSSLPSQAGTILPDSGDGNATTYAAHTAGDGNIDLDANQVITTGGDSNTVSATTSGGAPGGTTTASTTATGTTTNSTTTTTGAGTTTTGGTTTNGTTTSGATTSGMTTSGTTTSGTTTSSGGTTTSGSTTTTGASTIPSTTGGPGNTSYNPSQLNAINGAVDSVSIGVSSALFRDSTQSGQATLVVILSDQANLCATLTQGGHPASSHQVRLVFFAGSAAWPANGSYTIDAPSPNSAATFSFYDSSGTQTLSSGYASLHSGQTQLTDYGHGPGGDAQGTAQGLVGSQSDGMSITFNATYCAAVQ